MNWIFKRLLKWLQRRCEHKAMKADLLEGDSREFAVAWCEECGAVRINQREIRMCEPTWW